MAGGRNQPTGDDIERVRTQEEIQADARRYVDECARGEHGFWRMVLARLDQEGMVNERVRGETVNASTAELQGNLRQAPQIPVVNYLTVPHPELRQSVTDAADPGMVGDTANAWRSLGDGMIEFQGVFARAIDASRPDWQGRAGDAAREFLVRVGNYVGTAGAGAKLAGTQALEHSDALQRVRDSMPEPVDFDVAAAWADLQRTTDPNEYARKQEEFWRSYEAQRSAHEEAARLAGSFDHSISGASVLPSFPAPPAFGDGEGGDPGTGREPDRGGVDPGRPGGDPVEPGRLTGEQVEGGTHSDTGSTGRDVPAAPVGQETPARTTPGSVIPSPVDVNMSTGVPGAQTGATAPVPIGGLAGGGPAGSSGRSNGIPRGGGPNPYGAPGSGGGPGSGGRGPGGGGAAPGAGATSAGSKGRGIGIGGLPIGVGRGAGPEDIVHERPEYLVEADPEGLFGSDVATSPQVIGE